jgi:predicted dehydrogenase
MTGAPVGVGVVGCGVIGSRRAAIAAAHAGSRVIAVADVDPSRAERVASVSGALAAPDWRGVVGRPDVDVVVVATTHDWLAPISTEALRAGKHVLCEKPMSRTSREAEAVLATSRAVGRHVAIGFNHRLHPAILQARVLVERGAVGDLLFARCRYGHGGRPGYGDEWRANRDVSGGGELLDQGIHAIDLFRWFLGDLVEASGMVATWVWNPRVEDNVFATFRTGRGQIASLHASWTQWKNLFSFEVFGHEGALVIDGLGHSYGTERLTIYYRPAHGGAPKEETFEFTDPDPSWEREWGCFLAAIRGEPSPLASAVDGVAALKLVEAVYAASDSGTTVRVVAT